METKLTHIALHLVGNKAEEEGVHLAKSNVSLDEDLRNILSKFFLNAFNIGEFFHLYHDSGLEYNVVHAASITSRGNMKMIMMSLSMIISPFQTMPSRNNSVPTSA